MANEVEQAAFTVDKCYVVNLRKNADRWQTFEEYAGNWQRAFGVMPERFEAVYGVELDGFDMAPWFNSRIPLQRKRAWAGKAGCILSHAGVIRDALARGCDHILVLEDDAFLDQERLQVWLAGLADLVDALPPDWASVNLCTAKPVTPCRVESSYQDYRLLEVAGAFGAVAYLLNGRCLQRIAQELPTEQTVWEWVARYKTIDRWYSQNLCRFGAVYAFSPSLVGHQEGASDISMNAEEIWRVDFSLKDAPITEGYTAFHLKRVLRLLTSAMGRALSASRLALKRRRGL